MAEFMEAAFPWIAIGLFVAVSCVLMNKKNNRNSEEEQENNGKN